MRSSEGGGVTHSRGRSCSTGKNSRRNSVVLMASRPEGSREIAISRANKSVKTTARMAGRRFLWVGEADVAKMFLQRCSEGVTAVGAGGEEQVLGLLGTQHCQQRAEARVGDGAWR